MINFQIIKDAPSVEDFIMLRKETGMSPRSIAGAHAGINNSWYAIHIRRRDATIGMGRIIGDGGCTFIISDVAVLPEFQGKGIGTAIIRTLMDYFKKNAPEKAYLTLMADGDAKYLYKKFGFIETAPDTIGMEYRPAEAEK